MSKAFFITTAIDYTNGAPHIGHAYEKVLADVIARYRRLKGEEVFFLTGVDQHGQKVQQSAEKKGVAPEQFVGEITAKFLALWEKLDVRYDRWAATTDPVHKECVRKILQRLWDEKKIYKDKQGGYYSIRQEQFLTDKERGPDGEFGPEWGEVEFREEENFYFRLKEHKQWLLDLIDKRHPRNAECGMRNAERENLAADAVVVEQPTGTETPLSSATRDPHSAIPFVIPAFRAAELRNAVEKLDGDLCISRPASRLKWGIPFPESFGAGFVTYVWFDALVNYISFAGYDPNAECGMRNAEKGAPAPICSPTSTASATELPLSAIRNPHSAFHQLWPALHVIGKDILIPAHGVYWPIMLHALGFTDDEIPPLLVHGWWNIAGAKMSKSLGNIVDPDALADKYGAEAVRYYLMSDIATGKDADFSEERLVQRYNVDLANSLGNLLNRTLNMAQKYREGVVHFPDLTEWGTQMPLPDNPTAMDEIFEWFHGFESAGGRVNLGDLQNSLKDAVKAYVALANDFEIHLALNQIVEATTWVNRMIDNAAPWKLAKDVSNQSQARLDAVLCTLAESLRIIAILISPVLPKAALGIFDQLDPERKLSREFRLADARWGVLEDGHVVGKPVPLFPRIEPPAA